MSEELTMLADILDSSGLHSEAGEIDGVIRTLAQDSSVHRSATEFWDYFRQHMMQEVANPDSPISEKSLARMDEMAKYVFEKYHLSPSVSEETMDELKKGSPHEMATSILALEENIMELDGIIEQTTDQKTKDNYELQKERYIVEMDKRFKIFDRMAAGGGRKGDIERVKQIYDILARRRAELGKTQEQRLRQRVDTTLEREK